MGIKNLGMVLLGVWLILTGAVPLLEISLPFDTGTVMPVLALVAGILILLGR